MDDVIRQTAQLILLQSKQWRLQVREHAMDSSRHHLQTGYVRTVNKAAGFMYFDIRQIHFTRRYETFAVACAWA